jgi:hypothetical protein
MARSKKPVEACEPSSSNSDEDNSTSTENKSLSKGKSGSTRKMTDIGAVCKAKWLFYNDNKNNKNIVDDWVQKRKSAGLPYQKPKVVTLRQVKNDTVVLLFYFIFLVKYVFFRFT